MRSILLFDQPFTSYKQKKKNRKKFQLSTFLLYWINLKTIKLRSLPERAILFRQSGEGGPLVGQLVVWSVGHILLFLMISFDVTAPAQMV